MRWALVAGLVSSAIGLLPSLVGFRVLESGAATGNFTDDSSFLAYSTGFTHRTYDAVSPHRAAARVNPGVGVSLVTGPVQSCPSMVGPFDGGAYFCTSREHGVCDVRLGVCDCRAGYSGVACEQCRPDYFAMPNNVGSISCYPKVLCPLDCSGAGECDYWTGQCSCSPHRTGPDCATELCAGLDAHCEVCSSAACLRCGQGFYLNASACISCRSFDPRCVDCAASGCLQCADSVLSSTRRSGFRQGDELPFDDVAREFATTLPFGSQSPEAFAQAETYLLVQGRGSLQDSALSCTQGLHLNASWACSPALISHRVCGHAGTFSFEHPSYRVPENVAYLRLTVVRTGGGAFPVHIRYSLRHVTTSSADVSPTAPYTSSQTLFFDTGVVEMSFLVTVLDDVLVEADEVFQVALGPPSSGSLGPQARANVTIVDDDSLATVEPLNSPFLCFMPSTSPGNSSALNFSETVVAAGDVFSVGVQLRFTSGAAVAVSLGYPALLARVLTPTLTPALTPASTDGDVARRAYEDRHRITVTDMQDGRFNISGVIDLPGTYSVAAWFAFPGGLLGSYYEDPHFQRLALRRIDRLVDFAWDAGKEALSVRWEGCLSVSESGVYYLGVAVNDSARLTVDGAVMLDHWYGRREYVEQARAVRLREGTLYTLVLELRAVASQSFVRLLWGPTPSQLTAVPAEALFSLHPVAGAFPITVLPSEVAAGESVCFGEGLFTASTGLTAGFECCPKDKFGNPASVGLGELSASARMISDPSQHFDCSVVFDASSGCFRGQYVSYVAGDLSLDVSYRVDRFAAYVAVAGAPFLLLVKPSPTSYFFSFTDGLPTAASIVSSACINFTVVARDGWGNFRNTGGDSFEVSAVRIRFLAGDPSSAFDVVRVGSVRDLGNGNYSASICSLDWAGVYDLHVLLVGDSGLGSEIATSPTVVIVRNGPAVASQTAAAGSGLGSATAGVPATFTVTLRDAAGNIVREGLGGAAIVVLLDSAPSASFFNAGNGTVIVDYTAVRSGISVLTVAVGGQSIDGSPFSVNVTAGLVSAATSTGSGSGLTRGVAGQASVFVVSAGDLSDNIVLTSADVFAFNATALKDNSTGVYGVLQPCSDAVAECRGLNDGRYYGVFVPLITGPWRLSVFLSTSTGNQELSGSPYFPVVAPGPAAASTSLVSGDIFYATAGEPSRVAVRLVDAYGNPLIQGGDMVEVLLLDVASNWTSSGVLCCPPDALDNLRYYGFGGKVLSASVVDLSDGTYEASFAVDASGLYVLRASVLVSGLNASYYNSTSPSFLQNSMASVSWTGDISSTPQVAAFAEQTASLATIGEAFSPKHWPDYWGVTYSGKIRPEFAEMYTFTLECDSFSNASLRISSDLVLNASGSASAVGTYFFSDRTAYYDFELRYSHATDDARLALSWQSLSTSPALVPPSALFRSENISHTNLSVSPSALSALRSVTVGAKPHFATAGAMGSLLVETRDRFGNTLRRGGDLVQLFGVMGDGSVVSATNVVDFGNATYEVQFEARLSGTMKAYVTVGCCPPAPDLGAFEVLDSARELFTGDSPVQVLVLADVASPHLSYASGPALRTPVVAGSLSSLVVWFVDGFGNPAADSSGAALSSTFLAQTGAEYTPAYLSIAHFPNYAEVTFNVTQAVQLSVSVSMSVEERGGERLVPIKGSPFSVTVVAGAAEASRCLARGLGLRYVTVGEPSAFKIQLFDFFGNPAPAKGQYLLSTAVGPEALDNSPAVAVAAAGDESQTYYYTLSHPGQFLLHLELVSSAGLLGRYFIGRAGDPHESLAPLFARVDPQLSFSWPSVMSLLAGHYTPALPRGSHFAMATWTGFVVAPVTEEYEIQVVAGGNIEAEVFLSSALVFSSSAGINVTTVSRLGARTAHRLLVTVRPVQSDSGNSLEPSVSVSLVWKTRFTRWAPVPPSVLFCEAGPIKGSPFHVTASTLP